jgi:Ca-activated chloride channel family protein
LPLPEGVSRNALGKLSRYEIPPGDPFIAVWAPADARRVTAFFPFGLIKDLTYDEGRDKWRGRFLVPAGIPDGYYKILVAIETADEQIRYREEVYHLDSLVGDFETNFDDARVRSGKGILLKVDAIEAADEVYVHCEALGWNRVTLEPEDKEKSVDFSKWLKIPADTEAGQYEILVVVRDSAGNRLEKTVYITVYEA